ncbi:MAG: hypothetical protein Q7P63_05005 [Verrucomicrobiota bacterium JB022]|nr:hypothetical protein [Verrucomicrobiota bacterium JB022]
MKALVSLCLALLAAAHLSARTVEEQLALGSGQLDTRVYIADHGQSLSLQLDVAQEGIEALLQIGPESRTIVSVPVETRNGAFTIGREYVRDARIVFADQAGHTATLPLAQLFRASELPSSRPAGPPAETRQPAPEPERDSQSYSRGKSRFLRVE